MLEEKIPSQNIDISYLSLGQYNNYASNNNSNMYMIPALKNELYYSNMKTLQQIISEEPLNQYASKNKFPQKDCTTIESIIYGLKNESSLYQQIQYKN